MKSWIQLRWLVLLLSALPMIVGGCASSGATSFIHPNVDFGHIRRCALLPFENLTPDEFADERVQSIFLMEILEEGVLEIIGPGEALFAMRALRVEPSSSLSPETVKLIGERLSVDAVFFGTIENYGVNKADRERHNEVTAIFTMAETETGVVIWQSQVHAGGISIWRKLFGLNSASMHDVSRTAVKKALKTLL